MMKTRVSGPIDKSPLGPLDPRLAAWRPDFADLALAELVATPHYATPLRQCVQAASVPILATPDDRATATSELLYGEAFALLDTVGHFGWGYSVADHYVGYVSLGALASPAQTDTPERVGPTDALLFAEPSIKAPVREMLPLGSLVHPGAAEGDFVQVGDGWLHRKHLLGNATPDWVDIALSFIGTPYRWGGRTRRGVDCSGLVQIARQTGGHACRRDSDMQIADTRRPEGAPARGDVVWWPGHIGILLDGGQLLHANAFHMSCVVESLATVRDRIGAEPVIGRFAP